jgi:hypothetical protein
VDFYALPRFSPDGKKLAWMQWNHPDMPWNGAEVYVADIAIAGEGESLEVANPKRIAGERSKISACYPLWVSPTLLLFTADESGFVNPWVYDTIQGKAKALLAKPVDEDFAKPFWVLGESSFDVVDLGGGRKVLVVSAVQAGRDVVYFVPLDAAGGVEPVKQDFPLVTASAVRAAGKGKVVLVGGTGNEKKAIYEVSVTLVRRLFCLKR